MAADDVILRHRVQELRPARHLEFGTWLGDGVVRCVEECDATVWTINLLEGETLENGRWTYGALAKDLPGGSGCVGRDDGRRRRDLGADGRARTDRPQVPRRRLGQASLSDLCRQPVMGHAQLSAGVFRYGVHRRRPRGGHRRQRHEAGDRAGSPGRAASCGTTSVRCPRSPARAAARAASWDSSSEHREELGRFFERLFWVQPSWLLFGIRR